MSLSFKNQFRYKVLAGWNRMRIKISARFVVFALIWLSCKPCSLAEESVDFTNDIIPLLTKHGCNAGACHGAAIGRGGFKLSLYGGAPDLDYEAIVRQLGGRRINLADPTRSLVVLKPSLEVDHGGDQVFDLESDSALLLKVWIAQGASQHSTRRLARVDIQPKRQVASSVGEKIQLHATAFYSDSTQRDVTKWTIFTPDDSSAVEIVDSTAKVRRRGRHIVVARYLTEVVPIELVVPLNDALPNGSSDNKAGFVDAAKSFIDQRVLDSLTTLGLEPSPQIDDVTFLRRISLDLTGRLPATEKVKNVCEASNPLNRTSLIDELLGSVEFNEYWTLQLAKLLRIRPLRDDSEGAAAYHKWLASAVRDQHGYDKLATELITALGDSHEYGPANFHRSAGDARKEAEFFSELFMGTRLRCANCHNHPLDRWTQDDYHGLAAIFAKLERGRVVGDKPKGKVIHPRTLEPAVAKLPAAELQSPPADGNEERAALAEWLTSRENPFFRKSDRQSAVEAHDGSRAGGAGRRFSFYQSGNSSGAA